MNAGVARVLPLAGGAIALVAGVAGGLGRLGAIAAPPVTVSIHSALMVSGFLGTVIALERAVALGRKAAYAAPLASAMGSILLLAGWTSLAQASWIAAAVVLVVASLAIVRRQPMAHTALLALAASSWLAGNVAFALGHASGVVESWLGFAILTICAERLELSRLMPRPPRAAATFRWAISLTVAAIAAAYVDPATAGLAFGVALVCLAAWLAKYDLARRTVHMAGLARFAAVALLGGYAWLAAAGIAWSLDALGVAGLRDLALHGVALGFVFSMILAHAPIILPAVARVRVPFQPLFYLPLALLHGSLLVRFAGAALWPRGQAAGGAWNAAAIALFAGLMVAAVLKPAGVQGE